MQHTAIFFDIDDTLYDSSRQSTYARAHAIEAMIDAGLPVDEKTAAATLDSVIKQHGSNYPYHYNQLLTELGLDPNPHVVAAGIVAYHSVKLAYLRPFEETMPALLALRDRGYRLGIITNGLAVKQWEKLIRLGLQHVFHGVAISEEIGSEKPAADIFHHACRQLAVEPAASMFVGNHPDSDITGANRVGMTSIRVLKGKYRDRPAQTPDGEADHTIESLGQLLDLFESGKLS